MGTRCERNHPHRDTIISLCPVGDAAQLLRHDDAICLDTDMATYHRFVYDEVLPRLCHPLRQLQLTLETQFHELINLLRVY
jgi:hypothetical protein